MEEKQIKNYIKAKGTICPYCSSKYITAGTIDAEEAKAWQDISCDDCGSEWRDIYELKTIVEVK